MKPHRALFDHALAEAQAATGERLDPARVLLVGDSRTSDVAGALGSGLAGRLDRRNRGAGRPEAFAARRASRRGRKCRFNA